MTGATCRASSRMARRSTALAVRWAAVAATLVVVGVVALTTAAAGAPPPSARAGVPAACVKTRTCACVYPPGAPADAPDAACTLRKCVTCPCARGGACTSALVLTQVGAGDEAGADELPSTWGGPPAMDRGAAATAPPTPTPTPAAATTPPAREGRGGGRAGGCLAPGTPCGFSPSAPGCCGGRSCVGEGPFRMCEE